MCFSLFLIGPQLAVGLTQKIIGDRHAVREVEKMVETTNIHTYSTLWSSNILAGKFPN